MYMLRSTQVGQSYFDGIVKPTRVASADTFQQGGNGLFPLSVKHFHEQGLCWSTSGTMLDVQMFLASGGHRMYLGYNTYQLAKFVLITIIPIITTTVWTIYLCKTYRYRGVTRQSVVQQRCLNVSVTLQHRLLVRNASDIRKICYEIKEKESKTPQNSSRLEQIFLNIQTTSHKRNVHFALIFWGNNTLYTSDGVVFVLRPAFCFGVSG